MLGHINKLQQPEIPKLKYELKYELRYELKYELKIQYRNVQRKTALAAPFFD